MSQSAADTVESLIKHSVQTAMVISCNPTPSHQGQLTYTFRLTLSHTGHRMLEHEDVSRGLNLRIVIPIMCALSCGALDQLNPYYLYSTCSICYGHGARQVAEPNFSCTYPLLRQAAFRAQLNQMTFEWIARYPLIFMLECEVIYCPAIRSGSVLLLSPMLVTLCCVGLSEFADVTQVKNPDIGQSFQWSSQ